MTTQNFGKVINNQLQLAPYPVEIENRTFFTNSAEIYLRAGYKENIYTEYPEDGKTYASSWTETDTKNIRVWTEVEPIKPTYAELVEMYIRERYTVSDELALLRQRETKPEDFAAYFEYAEECKERAKRELDD